MGLGAPEAPVPPSLPQLRALAWLTRTVWFLMVMVGTWERRNSVAVPATFTRSKSRNSWGQGDRLRDRDGTHRGQHVDDDGDTDEEGTEQMTWTRMMGDTWIQQGRR